VSKHVRESISCADVEPLLPLIADGSLQPNEEVAVFEHLYSCDCCQDALARHDAVSFALGGSAEQASTSLRIVHRQLSVPWMIASAAAAAAVVAIVLSGRPMAEQRGTTLKVAREGSQPRFDREVKRLLDPKDPSRSIGVLITKDDGSCYLITDAQPPDPFAPKPKKEAIQVRAPVKTAP
jgi:hypothetical protein